MRPLATVRVAARHARSALTPPQHTAASLCRVAPLALRSSPCPSRLLSSHPSRSMSSSASSSSSSRAASSPAAASPSSRRLHGLDHSVCAVLGGQWGDEGKGKLVDILARDYDVIARFNGGSNAGHTLVVDGRKFAFHLLPCGLLYEDKVNVIGNGVVVHVPTMLQELDRLQEGGKFDQRAERSARSQRLLISDRAHLLFDFHQTVDGQQEKSLKADNIGTTKKGIGPAYASKATRNGIRVGELLDFAHFAKRLQQLASSVSSQYGVSVDVASELEKYRSYRERIGHMIVDTGYFVQQALRDGRRVLAEGANAALLDIDHGTYPYVTSSSTTAGGVCTGLGIPPRALTGCVGVVKAYTTRVGSGPFPSELDDDVGRRLREVGHEFGTTTGRPRRCGWLDIPVVQYGHAINGYDSINVTKLDVLTGIPALQLATHYTLDGRTLPAGQMPSTLQQLAACEVQYEELPGWSEDISACRSIAELPDNAQRYLQRIEQLVGVPVTWVGVGASRSDMARRDAQ